jgi:hypothetical protein
MHTTIRSRIEKCHLLPRVPSPVRRRPPSRSFWTHPHYSGVLLPQSSTHYLPAEATFVTPFGISPAAKYARSEPNYPSTSYERTSKNAMTGQTTSTIPSAGGLTGQPVSDSLTVSGHSCSNLVISGYPSACAKDDAVLRLTSALNATKSRPFPICTAARPGHRGAIGV